MQLARQRKGIKIGKAIDEMIAYTENLQQSTKKLEQVNLERFQDIDQHLKINCISTG